MSELSEAELERILDMPDSDDVQAMVAEIRRLRSELAEAREVADSVGRALEECYQQLQDQQAMPDHSADAIYASALDTWAALRAAVTAKEGSE